MALEIRPVQSKKDMDAFIQVAWDINGNDSNWVPPLRIAVSDTLNPKKNPFFKHAEAVQWVAKRDGNRVGRICAVIDHTHNTFHDEKTGFWGFFESENNQETANALFEIASAWLKSKGMKTMRGPMNPSTNHECGLQISAFETQPYIMMTQNPSYYPTLVDKAGLTKAKDLFAWEVSNECQFDQKILARAEALEKSGDIKWRHVNMKDYDAEVERILEVYNDAWEKNWGFVPMTDEEFRHMAKDMKAIVVPELLYIVEVRGEIAGFGLCLPDVNQVIAKNRSGKLFPTGLISLLWNLKVKKSYNRGRVLTLGVKKKFQTLGLAPLMYAKYIKDGPKYGVPKAECSWILEDNVPMNKGLQYMNAKMYKTYRIYDKAL